MFYLNIRQLIISVRYYFFVVIRNFLKKRFIPITLPFFTNQIIFDKKNKKNIYVKIRDYTDWQTLSQVFYNEDYNLEKLTRFKGINKFYLETGVPILLNTSLNIKGQPLLNDEKDIVNWEKKYNSKIIR